FRGKVALIFQPAEENGAGGEVMVREGIMERFGIEQVYAMHNSPGLPEGEVRLTPPTMDTCNGATCTRQFAFVRRSYDTTTSPAAPQTHEYRLTLSPTTTVTNEDGSSLQLYEVQRSERISGGAWVPAGASPASLSHFRVSLQDNSGAPTASESDAAFVEVAFALVPPLLHDDLVLSELNWSAVFRLHPV
ncbi:MAG: M20/M25/M40 family metallo-hydrolase, partial [Bacteroidota bacterium]